MSWAPEVQTNGRDEWAGNSLRFATEQEAWDNVRDLQMRWFAVDNVSVRETADPVNYAWIDGKLAPVATDGTVDTGNAVKPATRVTL